MTNNSNLQNRADLGLESDNHLLFQLAKSEIFTIPADSDLRLKMTFSDSSDLINEAKEQLNYLINLDNNGLELFRNQVLAIRKSCSELINLSGIWSEIRHYYIAGADRADDLGEHDEQRTEFFNGLNPALESFIENASRATNQIIINKLYRDRESLLKLPEDAKKARLTIEKNMEISKEILDAHSILPKKIEIDNYTKVFNTESEKFKVQGNWWLGGIIVILSIIVGLSIWHSSAILGGSFSKLSTEDIIQFNLGKILIISCLFYGLSICTKNFKNSKHNEILNKHRENALSSFQAFVSTPSADENTKNTVLLEVTRTIFSNQKTGYLASDKDEDNTSKIIDLLKTVQPK